MAVAAACGSYGQRDPEAAGQATRAAAVEAEVSNEDAAALHLAACPVGETDRGVDADEIRIGTSLPQTGPSAPLGAILPGARAYLDLVNDAGGVDGRRVVLEALDDQGDPADTSANVEELLEDEEVFALFGVVGTPNVLAFWDATEERCVPNLFVATGSPYWGDEGGHPWTIGSLPSYGAEAVIFAEHVAGVRPGGTVAILEQDDDVGAAYADGLREAVEETDVTIVATERFEPGTTDVTAQVEALAATGADALLAAVSGLACPAAMQAVAASGWDPLLYISGTCVAAPLLDLAGAAADGVLSTTYLKDPADPGWDADPALQAYRRQLAVTAPGADPANGFTAYGWTMAAALVEVLRAADQLTRPAVMVAARHLDRVDAGLLLPGVSLTTGPGDPYPVERTQLMQHDVGTGLWAYLAPGEAAGRPAGPATVSLSGREGGTPSFAR